jgi:hypothetical protein
MAPGTMKRRNSLLFMDQVSQVRTTGDEAPSGEPPQSLPDVAAREEKAGEIKDLFDDVPQTAEEQQVVAGYSRIWKMIATAKHMSTKPGDIAAFIDEQKLPAERIEQLMLEDILHILQMSKPDFHIVRRMAEKYPPAATLLQRPDVQAAAERKTEEFLGFDERDLDPNFIETVFTREKFFSILKKETLVRLHADLRHGRWDEFTSRFVARFKNGGPGFGGGVGRDRLNYTYAEEFRSDPEIRAAAQALFEKMGPDGRTGVGNQEFFEMFGLESQAA